MDGTFRERGLEPRRLRDRLLRRQSPRNAVIEIENRLARASKVREVSPEDVERVAAAYRLDLRSQREPLARLYRVYLERCVRDRLLTDTEVDDLEHLKGILQLDDAAIRRLHDQVAGDVYGEAVGTAIADGRLRPDERSFLERLQAQLRLDEAIVRRIHARKVKDLVAQRVRSAEENERLHPHQEAELEALARSLRVEIRLGERTRRLLEKFRFYWLIENGDVPEIDTRLPLQRGEACYFVADADWYEPRRVTRRVGAGPTLRIRIAEGSYRRMGDLGVQRASEDLMARVDSGRVYVTNKRLVFQGARGDEPLRIGAISDFTAYRNGVELDRASAPSLFLRFDRDVDLFAMILGRVVRDARGS